MARLIRREDVDAVRERAKIEEIVGEQVTLKPAGVGSLKGLCPFHDERTPSFTVRPATGRYKCFGCGEGGDVIAFVQQVNALSFAEAVEQLADRFGVQLRYETGAAQTDQRARAAPGLRQRALAANQAASAYYATQLFDGDPDGAATVGRRFLAERSFTRADAERFGVGFAPTGWDHLTRALTGRGFTAQELLAAGLVVEGRRGLYDRFRGRLVWPIRDTAGAVLGFGARRLLDDDPGPKYLNTPETALFRKSQVLYGIDLAKKAISQARRVVIVEGYTDVMAMHLSGVAGAVATCGTSFGAEHAKLLRRLLGDFAPGAGLKLADGQSLGGEIIFTFDGDTAGQAAAVRAFSQEQRFHAQTFVAVEPSGLDPCELRIARGPTALRALVDARVPLFEFVIRARLRGFDLGTVEGRVGALRETAPLVARIRDQAMQLGYARSLADWLGLEPDDVRAAVARAARPRTAPSGTPRASTKDWNRADPVVATEWAMLLGVLQFPALVPDAFDELAADAFTVPAFAALHAAIAAAGGIATGRMLPGPRWIDAVRESAGLTLEPLIDELAVADLPQDRPADLEPYLADLLRAVTRARVTRLIAEAKSRIRRTDPARDPEGHAVTMRELVALESLRHQLRNPR